MRFTRRKIEGGVEALREYDYTNFLKPNSQSRNLNIYGSDPKIILGYIHNDAKRFHTFVANGLSQLNDLSDISQSNYVRTEKNPVDIASRGV